MKKRLLSAFLAITMILTLIPAMSVSSSAEDAENPSETIAFNDRETAESEHFTLKGYPLRGGWLIESYTIAGHDVTITAKDPNTVILGIDAVVEAYGDRYNTVKYSSGEKLETDPVEDGSTVHVTNINSDKLVINCQYDFRIKDFTIYYTHKHSFTGISKDNGDGTHSKKCSSADCSVYGDPQEHTYKPVAKAGDDPLIFTAKCTDCTSTIHNYQIENKTFTYTGSINYGDVKVEYTLKGGTKLKANYSLGDADMIVYVDGQKAADVKEGEYWVASQCVECVNFTSNWFSTDPLQIWFKSICEYTIASCETPETCMYCGHTKGEPLGHSFEGNTCTFCGKTKCEINGHTFENNTCTVCGLDEFVIEDGVLVRYNGYGGDVVIPDGVTSIGISAFAYCSGLKNVTIPDSLKIIKNNAFTGCTNLMSVRIPNSVISIGNLAFYNCSSLQNITIPNSVTSIGNHAFYFCTNLTSVTISDKVSSMGDFVFFQCENIRDVYIPCDNNADTVKRIMQPYGDFKYTKLDHDFKDNKCQSCGVKEFDIIDGVLYGYYGKGGDVVIPDGVTGIKGAFSNCSSVTSVAIPNSVTSIGAKSFENCVSLTSVVIPCSVKTIGDCAFESCVSLSSITISGNIDIGDSIFDDCGSLVNVYCNCDSDIESVKAFMEDYGRYMFTYTQLEHTFVNNICSACGAKCTDFVIENGVLVGYNGKGGDIVIPDEATEIDNDVFLFNQTITSVKMPNVTKIGKNAFANCYKLTSADMPQIESLGSDVFNGCFELVSADLPNVTSIGGSAFKDSSLQSIDISKAANIDNGAFFDCDELTYVTMNSNVELGSFVFDSCTKLKTIYCTCDSDINALINKMDQYGDFTYTKLDHNFVDGVCTACGEKEQLDELAKAKQDAIAEIKAAKTEANSSVAEMAIADINAATSADEITAIKTKALTDMYYADQAAALVEAKKKGIADINAAAEAAGSSPAIQEIVEEAIKEINAANVLWVVNLCVSDALERIEIIASRPEDAPAGEDFNECACSTHPGCDHLYSFGKVMGEDDMTFVAGLQYIYSKNSIYFNGAILPLFTDGYEPGWYYYDETGLLIPCDGHVTAEEILAQAKADAIAEIENVKTGASFAIAAKAVTDIEAATSVDDVNTIKTKALSDMAKADEDAAYGKALTAAKDEALEAVDNAKDAAISDAAKNVSIYPIFNAVTLEEVAAAKAEALNAIAAAEKELADAKTAAKSAIDTAAGSNQSAKMQTIVSEAKGSIDNAKATGEVENAKRTGLAKIEAQKQTEKPVEPTNPDVCQKCGHSHSNGFFGQIICFFYRLINWFMSIFG